MRKVLAEHRASKEPLVKKVPLEQRVKLGIAEHKVRRVKRV